MLEWFYTTTLLLISTMTAYASFTTLIPAGARCHLNSTDINECDEQANYIHGGKFHENFLANPNVENFDALCNMYQKWLFCVRSAAAARCNGSYSSSSPSSSSAYSSRSSLERDLLGRSRTIIVQTCTIKREQSLTNLLCLSTQSRESNHLFNGCYVMMQLRRKSQVMELCRLMSDFLQCEDRLIRSACGSAIADFRLAVSMETALNPASLNQKCLYSSTTNYLGFVYTISCPPEFPELMRMCYRDFMGARVVFYPALLAVVKSSPETIDLWCTLLTQYKQCLAPIEQQCRDGVNEIYAMSADWNKHLHIARYICEIASFNYRRFLPCYVRAVQSSTYPILCRQLFEAYPSMHEMYAAQCLPNSTDSISTIDLRQKLIDCYSLFMQRECGKTARDTIAPLIRMQYSFDFMPPCYAADIVTERPPTVCACSQVKNEASALLPNAFHMISTFLVLDCCSIVWYSLHSFAVYLNSTLRQAVCSPGNIIMPK